MSENCIEWWAIPEDNAVWYQHIGCDDPPARWLVPMDDCPLPDSADAECAHCCYVRPLRERVKA